MFEKYYLLVFVILAIITVTIILIYKAIYKKQINQQLVGKRKQSKKLWTPLKMCVVSVITSLFICSVLFAIHVTPADMEQQPVISCNVYTMEELQNSPLSYLSVESNIGYEKYEKNIDGIKYTYFISSEPLDNFHPAFIVFAEYIGTENMFYKDILIQFNSISSKEIGSYIEAGTEYNNDIICIVGNSSSVCEVSCIIDVYEKLADNEEVNFDKLKEKHKALNFQITQ